MGLASLNPSSSPKASNKEVQVFSVKVEATGSDLQGNQDRSRGALRRI